jgi:2-phosphosulfolactate phosphatase
VGTPFDQRRWRARFDWGPNGLRNVVAPVVVIVDVLSFTTAVGVAVEQGAAVYPYRWHDDASAFAAERDAIVAGSRWEHGFSLSPTSLRALPHGSRLVLPSPNGSALAFAAQERDGGTVIAACLRNASAVAAHVESLVDGARSGAVVVIGAGERWNGATGPLRPAVEDLLGAGAVLSALPTSWRSPEAEVAVAAFDGVRQRLPEVLSGCASGRELADRGFAGDVALAAEHDVSTMVPLLGADGAFRHAGV